MTNEKKSKDVKTKKPKTAKQPTVVSVVKTLAPQGAKDRATLAQSVFEHLTSKGITQNSKGKPIKLENVLNLISAMTRDITSERRGWWANWEAVEDDTQFVLRSKTTV